MHHEGDLLLQPPDAATSVKSAAQEVILRSPPDVTGRTDRWIRDESSASTAAPIAPVRGSRRVVVAVVRELRVGLASASAFALLARRSRSWLSGFELAPIARVRCARGRRGSVLRSLRAVRSENERVSRFAHRERCASRDVRTTTSRRRCTSAGPIRPPGDRSRLAIRPGRGAPLSARSGLWSRDGRRPPRRSARTGVSMDRWSRRDAGSDPRAPDLAHCFLPGKRCRGQPPRSRFRRGLWLPGCCTPGHQSVSSVVPRSSAAAKTRVAPASSPAALGGRSRRSRPSARRAGAS